MKIFFQKILYLQNNKWISFLPSVRN